MKINLTAFNSCHIKNIMSQNDELLLIDMDTLSVGHPIFELAAIMCSYVIFEEDDPGNCLRFFQLPKHTCDDIFHGIVKRYFGEDTQEIREKIKIVAYAHMLWWNRANEPENINSFERIKLRLFDLLTKYDNLEVNA